MKQPKPPFPYVRLTWLDAWSEDAWTKLKGYVIRDHRVETTGYLVAQTETMLLIAPTLAWDEAVNEWEACTMMGIPKGMLIGPTKVMRRAPVASKIRPLVM